MEDTLLNLYCLVDEFCQEFLPEWEKTLLSNGLRKRRRQTILATSEIMTIVIHFHQSHYRNFKHFYLQHVQKYLRGLFPNLVSYPRFITLVKSILVPLNFFLQTLKGEATGIYLVDSTILKACHIKRERQNRVFRGVAKKARSTIGRFFGFKLHLVINDVGEIMAFKITAGNVDDRDPVADLIRQLSGKLFGDKGYISQKLFETLMGQGVQLVTRVKKNMKNKLMPLMDKLLLNKRGVIESVNDQLKNICQVEHSRHRSTWGFMINTLAALCAYALRPKKPTIYKNIQGLIS